MVANILQYLFDYLIYVLHPPKGRAAKEICLLYWLVCCFRVS